MKKKRLRLALALALASPALLFSGCEQRTALKTSCDGDAGILLHKKLSATQEQKLNALLTGPSAYADVDELYHIRKHAADHTVTDTGKLHKDYELDDYDDSNDGNFVGHTIQIGLGLDKCFRRIEDGNASPSQTTSNQPPAQPTPSTMHAHYQIQINESKALVKAVDEILAGP